MQRDYFDDQTIVSVITPANAVSAVGIVRISGRNALDVALSTTSFCSKKVSKETIKSGVFYRCLAKDKTGRSIDDGMLVYMRNPKSFTGEDVVEVQLHGNPLILNRFVEATLNQKHVRPAARGEFTFRAFRNGKIDLSQAEGILDLIHSRTPTGAEVALSALEGKTKNRLAELKQKLVSLLAEVEVDIDFSDQGLSILNYKRWKEELSNWINEINQARRKFDRSKPLREGIRIALVGAPNSGKSTLFNTLLGENRSIVSDIAGTTRDVVRESFVLGDLLFLVSDTAGIRSTNDTIEKEGIERSLGEIRNAHLVLLLVDGTSPTQASEEYLKNQAARVAQENPAAKLLTVINKVDLVEEREGLFRRFPGELFLSAKNGAGLNELEQAIRTQFQSVQMDEQGLEIGRARQYELLGKAAECVDEAIRLVETGDAQPDLLSSSLRSALAHLGEITGEVTNDDVLNFIFSEFCIGK